MTLTPLRVEAFGKGINLVDPVEQLDLGYLGPLSRNVVPAGNGKSLHHSDGVTSTLALATSSTKRPSELTKYSAGQLVSFADGSVDRVVQSTGVSTNVAGTDAVGVPDVVVSQDSALTTYYAYVLRPNGSAQTSLKVNIGAGTNVTWPGAPPQGACAISWKTMMVIGQGSRVRFSALANPDSWPANSFVDIKTLDDALDDIVGFEILGEDLLVFKRRSTWMIFDPVSFDNRRLFSVGVANRKCITRLEDRVYWASLEGFYSTDGTEFKYESIKLGVMSTIWQPGANAGMIASPNGTIVVCDGGGLTVGYSQFRDAAGVMPWYSCRDTGYARIKCMVWANSDFSGASGTSDDPSFNGVVCGLWDSNGANTNSLGVGIGVSGAAGGSSSAHEGSVAVKSIIQLPTFHNSQVEEFSRMRRLSIYGHGTLGTTGVAAVEVYADNAGAPTFTQAGAAFVKEFLRYRPEVRGRTFNVIIRSDGTATDFEIHAVEAQFRPRHSDGG